MKNRFQLKKYLLMIVLLAIILLGIYLAFYLYRHYGVVARGISGIALVLLLLFFGKRSGLDVSFEVLLLDNQKSKFIISAIVAPILFWFAFAQIYEMILFLLK